MQLARYEYKSGFVRGDEWNPASLQRAHTHVDRALALDPKLVRAYVAKGFIYKCQKNYGDAQSMIDKALAIDADAAGAHQLRADLLARQGDLDAALASARKALESTKDPRIMHDTHATLGRVYQSMAAWDEAEETYIARMRIKPKSAWIRGNYARLLCRRGAGDRAIAMAKQALKLMDYPMGRLTLADAHATKAFELLQAKRYEDAKAEIAQGKAAFPASAEVAWAQAVYLRARAFAERDPKLFDAYTAQMKEVLKLDPRHKDASDASKSHAYWERRFKEGR